MDNPPSCLTDVDAEIPCPECPYWDKNPCPIESDSEYRSFVGWSVEQHRRLRHEAVERVAELRLVLHDHGLPLHWGVLASIAMTRRPELFPSPRTVLYLMSWHPEDFESLGNGVYKLAAR